LSLIPREKIDDVRERTNIVEVVKRHVELKRAGTASWKGLCPFHAEKTPSFHVHESRQFFHCFGCGEKGDVFSFLTRIEQRSFMEVLRDLARDVSVDLPEKQMSPAERQARADEESEKQRMWRAMEAAVAFFESQLAAPVGAAAREYLAGRGISPETASRFRVGYAPAAWDALQKHLLHKSIPLAVAEQLGLVGVNERGQYDFFRDRVMLPVFDRQKRPVGFSGRLLDPEAKAAKYVNSSDSPLFHKKELLYGLPFALDPIRRSSLAVVVEGNFDVLSLHEAGIAEAVAPMGTALTAEQVAQLGRVAERVVVVFDGDEAGERASRKAVPLFVEAGIDGRIARMPAKTDPDDFVRRDGAEAFKKLVENARPVVEQLIDDVSRGTEATIPGRMKSLELAAPIIARVRNPTERELYVGRLATALGLSVAQIWRAVRDAASGREAAAPRAGGADAPAAAATPAVPEEPCDEQELEALVLLASRPELWAKPEARRIEDLLTDPRLRSLCRTAREAIARDGRLDAPTWVEPASPLARTSVMQALMERSYDRVADPDRVLRSLEGRLALARVQAEFDATNKQLEEARKAGDSRTIPSLQKRLMELIQEKQRLTKALQRP
jgi:DNA primase